ncbi:MAG: polysaccharide deacetylase family protein [Alphaproteobacteria bacterium]|nr:polysaccharide deacetylase family protein [Alphaproteobacteria bacterium]
MPKDIWPGGARLALSLVVNVEEGSEMSIARGDRGPEPVDELGVALSKPIRNYGNESNYLYGIKAGAPRVFGLIGTYGYCTTVTAAAQSLETYPEVARLIVEGGHEAAAHGWRWVHQFRMDEDAERAFILRAADSIEATTGTRPTGWLSRYLLTENTRRLLIEEGFGYHMDDYSDDRPFVDAVTVSGKSIVVLPYALDTNDMKMWTDPAYTPEMWATYACDSIDWMLREGRDSPKMLSIGLHLRIIGRPGRMAALERVLEHVRQAGEAVWVARRAEIAQRWATVRGDAA